MAKKRVSKVVAGPGSSVVPVSPYQVSMQVAYAQSGGIVRGTGADWFGPHNPMAPIAPPEVAGRQFDFMPGANLVTTPRNNEAVGFPMLRALADSYDLVRLVIETRKDQVCKLKWKIKLREEADADEDGEPDEEQAAAISDIEKFFKRPDGVNRWRPWLREILEDLFVIDAPSIYCQRNRGGQLIALKPIDGGTVKVLIDDWGRTPQPYTDGGSTIWPPAYQQVLKGFPAVNYTVRDVIYRPYNKRVHKVYGYSPVEQIIMTVNIALRRQAFTLAYYTEGNIPESLIGTPDSWTPEQVAAFQTLWDQNFTGNLAKRRHAKFVPGGVAKTFIATKEPDLKNPMDEWLARIVCFAFSVSPQQLTAMMNRATAETSGDQSKEEGVEAIKGWVVELVNDVIENEFGRDDLTFAFDEEVEVDQEKQQKIVTALVDAGVKTINEGREMLGDEPDPSPAASVLMVKTATGFVPIDANTLEGKKAAIDAGLVADPTIPPVPFGGDPAAPPGKPGGGAFGRRPSTGKNPANDDKEPKPKPAPKAAEKAHGHAVFTAAFSKASKRARRLAEYPFDRAATGAAVRKITRLLAAALQKVGEGVAELVRDELGKAKETNEERARRLADEADLSAIFTVVDDIGEALGEAAADAGRYALAQVGVDKASDLVNVVNERAVAQARQFAAELVGMRYNKDGELVPSNRAEYRIDDTTRNMIRGLIESGLEDNIGTDAIADSIEGATAFSRDRAELIANTEVRRANSAGAVEGYLEARDSAGVDVKKEWMLGDNPCAICQENADAGAIDLDDEFPSGDDAPPAHPNCECAIAPVVVETEKPDDEREDEE